MFECPASGRELTCIAFTCSYILFMTLEFLTITVEIESLYI